jgi:tripartite ATP-independent transporter DctP family solute receptor
MPFAPCDPPSCPKRPNARAWQGWRVWLLAASAVLTLAAGSPNAWAQQKTLLRISTPAVPDDWHAKMWTVFKDTLEKDAPQQFEVQIHLNGTLFKQGTEPAAMARGNLEMASISAFDMAKQVPAFSVFTVPYVIRDVQHQQKVFASPVVEPLLKSVSERMDITVLGVAYLGTRQLALREPRAVKAPADLKGLKLRMPGSKEWLFLGNALGATATPLAFGEVYLGLKTGTIDAQDNPLPTVRAAKLYEVSKQVVLTQHLVDALFISVSNKTWHALSAAQQQALRHATQAAVNYNNTQRQKEESQVVDFLKQQGLQITTPDVAAFRQHVQAVYAPSDMAKSWPTGLIERIAAVR